MHLGHMIPFQFTLWLQKTFKCKLVIQITDDEKFYWSEDGRDFDHFKAIAVENIKDIITLGFDPADTFIFSNSNYMGVLYQEVIKFQKCLTYSQCKNIFGL